MIEVKIDGLGGVSKEARTNRRDDVPPHAHMQKLSSNMKHLYTHIHTPTTAFSL